MANLMWSARNHLTKADDREESRLCMGELGRLGQTRSLGQAAYRRRQTGCVSSGWAAGVRTRMRPGVVKA